ncbi:MAG: hypothetical protein ACI90V_002132 [Bacillariaceae sp.]|jgi:hypothetical protein
MHHFGACFLIDISPPPISGCTPLPSLSSNKYPPLPQPAETIRSVVPDQSLSVSHSSRRLKVLAEHVNCPNKLCPAHRLLYLFCSPRTRFLFHIPKIHLSLRTFDKTNVVESWFYSTERYRPDI